MSKEDLVRIVDHYFGTSLLYLLSFFRFKRKKEEVKINNILCIKLFGFGNLIMISPSLEELKLKYPNSKIDFLTLKQNKGVLESYNFVNKIYYLSFDSIFDLIISLFELIIRLRKNKYSLVIDFEQFARFSQILSFLIRPNLILGFFNKVQRRNYLLDLYSYYNNDIHSVENFYSLLFKLEIKNKKLSLPKFKKDSNQNKIILNYFKSNFINNHRYIIGIHPGVGVNAKVRMWPSKYFGNLINRLYLKYGVESIQIILTGSKLEKNDIDEVLKYVDEKYLKYIKFTFNLNLKNFIYLSSYFNLFISNDTGPLHIAAANNIKIIGLYGPNTPKLYGPYINNSFIFYKNLKCSPCITNLNNKKTNCKNNLCMKKILVDEVYLKIKEILDKDLN